MSRPTLAARDPATLAAYYAARVAGVAGVAVQCRYEPYVRAFWFAAQMPDGEPLRLARHCDALSADALDELGATIATQVASYAWAGALRTPE